MAILKLLAVMLVLVSGCYAPEVGDCTVTCTTDDECAGGLVCTTQGLCAGTDTACEDQGSGPRMIMLRVSVIGEGKVSIVDGPECIPDEDDDTCTLMVPAGPLAIDAVVLDDKPFERWTSIVCAGQGPRCQVTLQLDANVAAKFK